MDCETLKIILSSSSSDSKRNEILEKIINLVQNIQWDNLSSIIDCYSSDRSKIVAIRIISGKKIDGQISSYLSQLLEKFKSDSSRFDALVNLIDHINPTAEILYNVINIISSDPRKIDALSMLIDNMEKINESEIITILLNISSDLCKINALTLIVSKLDFISYETLLSIIKIISSDQEKVQCIALFSSKMKPLEFENICSILDEISNDRLKLIALQIFFNFYGSNLNSKQLLDIFRKFSFNKIE